MLKTRLFEERGFKRFKCKVCGHYFWSLVERDVCGDAPCMAYSFIRSSPAKIVVERLSQVRELFLSFFEKHGHTRVRKYPVVAARWRSDVYLVGASIYVFQPWVTSGIVPPPANPLVISQPCIRLTDVDIVGRSGRHLTGFEMMAHHAFNYPDRYVYWIDECVELAHKFFTEELKIPEEEIVYKESTWSGGGNAGECFEVLVRGLEIATLVFMHYKILPDGKLEEMPIKVIDTGYGLERIYWLLKASPNVYEAIFEPVLPRLRERLGFEKPDFNLLSRIAVTLSQFSSEDVARYDIFTKVAEHVGEDANTVRKVMLEQELVYALCDHVRSLSWMVYDGVMPSNTGIGYLARLLIRRILRYMYTLGVQIPLPELANIVFRWLIEEYPELRDVENTVLELLDIEEKKFKDALRQATSHISKLVKKSGKKSLTVDDLVTLYDAYGIPPEIVKQICDQMNVSVEIPPNFYAVLAERKQREVQEGVEESKKVNLSLEDVRDLPPTVELYYQDQYLREFDAKIIKVFRRGSKTYIVLDRTAFYPEGGGQPYDTGLLVLENGVKCAVTNVQKVGNVVVHEVSCDGPVEEGLNVHGVIDWERRYALMKMHTGTHVLLQALRRVLGPHVWQTGAQKDIPVSRLDITHYKVPSDEELKKVEELANKIIEEDWTVQVENLVRTEAEAKYSVRIYQGGFIPSPTLRIVKIVKGDEVYDVQACGGTHLKSTREIGMLKIVGVEKVQEGVIRVHFTTGKYVLEHTRDIENKLRKTAELLKCGVVEVPDRVKKLLEELKVQEETVRKYEKMLREYIVTSARSSGVHVGDVVLYFIDGTELSDKLIQDVARELTSVGKSMLVVYAKSGDSINLKLYSSSEFAKIIPVKDIVHELCKKFEQCRGGGSGTFAQVNIRGSVNVEDLKHVIVDLIECKTSTTG